MKFLRPIQVLVFAACATGPSFAPVAHAQTSPPWWQQIVKKAERNIASTVTSQLTSQTSGTRPTSTTTANSSNTANPSSSLAGAPTVASMSPNALLPFTRQTLIFRGSGFGNVEPFNGPTCFLQFVDITNRNLYLGGVPRIYANLPIAGDFYVTEWTDTTIVIKEIYGSGWRPPGESPPWGGSIADFHPGDLVRVEVANPQKVGQYPSHGLCGSPAARLFTHVASSLPGPRISSFSDGGAQTPVPGSSTVSISTIVPVAKQTITINGSGFGEHTPFQGHSRFLQVTDITANNWTSGASCANGCGTGPSVDVKSWTNSEVVLGGFPSGYGGADVLHPGDIVRISIANPQLAGDMGSVNSVFGGSPLTRIFVTVASPPQASQEATPMVPPTTSAVTTTGAIASISPISAQANPPVLVAGSGFGTFPQSLPFTRDSPYLRVQDTTQNWDAGYIAPKHWLGDTCTVSIWSWSNTAIAFTLNVNSTIGGVVPTSICSLHPGDTLRITVVNPQTQQSAAATTVITEPSVASQSSAAGITSLTLLFTTTAGSYIGFSQNELAKLIANVTSALQADHVSTTDMKVIASVVPSITIDTSTVNTLTSLIDLPMTATDGIQYVDALGSTGVAFFGTREALQYYFDSTSGNTPALPPGIPALVADEANSIISADAAAAAATQSDLAPTSPACNGYVPEYVFGPGESLEVVFTGLAAQPNGNIAVAFQYRLMDTGGVISGSGGAPSCTKESGASNYLKFQSNAPAVNAG